MKTFVITEDDVRLLEGQTISPASKCRYLRDKFPAAFESEWEEINMNEIRERFPDLLFTLLSNLPCLGSGEYKIEGGKIRRRKE